MKRLVVCCDGTWQDLGRTFPTNVAKIASAIKPISNGTPQCIYYGAGVGTKGLWDKIFGGGMGAEIDFHIKDAYRFLCLNYQPGDEIYLFGFSRGSYTVRSLVGLIYNSGLLLPQHLDKIDTQGALIGAYQLYRNRHEAYKPGSIIAKRFRQDFCVTVDSCLGDDQGRVPITLLACWETVGALGIPAMGWLNPKKFFSQRLIKKFPGKHRFYDTRLSRIVENAVHAVAIDEKRIVLNVTKMEKDNSKKDENGEVKTVTGANQNVAQVWFPGIHECIGGGFEHLQGLSDAALIWMMNQVDTLKLGLEFDRARMTNCPYPWSFDYKISFSKKWDWLRIPGIKWRTMDRDTQFNHDIHETAKLRWRDVLGYRPETLLRRFAKQLKLWAQENPLNEKSELNA
ncbi:MAG TPA: DUF2235 domain-containing protein [Chitinivibrionales bacterium]